MGSAFSADPEFLGGVMPNRPFAKEPPQKGTRAGKERPSGLGGRGEECPATRHAASVPHRYLAGHWALVSNL